METVLSILYYNTKCLGKQVLIRNLRCSAPSERYVRDEINPKIRLKPIHLTWYHYPQGIR